MMTTGRLGLYIIYNFALALLVLLVFGALRWFGIPAGQFFDWVVGVVSFWWLLVVVTVPWNVYFQARETLAEAALSVERGITVDAAQVAYVARIARRALWVALLLHVASAFGLYALAWTGASAVGYVGSVAALALTALRPSVRAYEYLSLRLGSIRRQLLHPREDVFELRGRVSVLEAKIEALEESLNPAHPGSMAERRRQFEETARAELSRLRADYRELAETNRAEHERISRATEHAVARLSADGQFLEHVRELIRFFKEA